MEQNTSANKQSRTATPLTLQARPERRYIRMESCDRAIDFHIQVGPAAVQDKPTRPPLNLVLVNEGEHRAEWQELPFSYASTTTCDAEPYNQEAMLQVGLQQADRARREAIGHNNKRDLAGARDVLQKTAQQIAAYAPPNSPLQQEIAALNELEQQLVAAPLPSQVAKERYYQQHSKSHFRRDHRESEDK